jgi:hypothetical protein
VPRHTNSQPAEFRRIGNAGIRHTARADGENQCVTDERRIAGDDQSRAAYLDAVSIDDDDRER